MKFGQKVNEIIIILHKKFQKNPHHRFGVMIKSLDASATRNEFAAHVTVHNAKRKQVAIILS
jgi:hypothetical protein